jgi:hypothetical protein
MGLEVEHILKKNFHRKQKNTFNCKNNLMNFKNEIDFLKILNMYVV